MVLSPAEKLTVAPYTIPDTLAYLGCRVKDSMDAATHTMFVGEIVDAGVLKEVEPMTYAFYHKVKNGKAPKAAPTYSAYSEGKK